MWHSHSQAPVLAYRSNSDREPLESSRTGWTNNVTREENELLLSREESDIEKEVDDDMDHGQAEVSEYL